MSIVKEVIQTIDFWSPPLKKHRYKMSSVRKKVFISSGQGSGLLMDELQRRDRLAAASGILSEQGPVYNEDGTYIEPGMDPNAAYYDGADQQDDTGEKAPKRRFRVLKRIEEIVYDDTAVKQGELEDEAYDVLNDDGFYDEILPVDYDEDIVMKSEVPIKQIALYGGLLAVLVGICAWVVMNYIL